MPYYYFHLYDGADWLADHEGIDLADHAAAVNAALYQARDVIAGDVRDGRIDLNLRIIVDDEMGQPAHILDFADAAVVTPQAEGQPPDPPPSIRRLSATRPDWLR